MKQLNRTMLQFLCINDILLQNLLTRKQLPIKLAFSSGSFGRIARNYAETVPFYKISTP